MIEFLYFLGYLFGVALIGFAVAAVVNLIKVYYPYRRCSFNEETNTYDEPGKWVVIEFEISELWKRMLPSQFFKFLKKCYFSKKKAQRFCDWKNAPDIDFGGVLKMKF